MRLRDMISKTKEKGSFRTKSQIEAIDIVGALNDGAKFNEYPWGYEYDNKSGFYVITKK